MESKTEKNTGSSADSQSKNKSQQAGKNSSYRQGENPDRTKSDKDSGYDSESESEFKMQTDKHADADRMESDSAAYPGQTRSKRPSKDSEQNPEQYDPNRDHEDSRDAYLKE